jgi:MFS family permease
MCLAAPNNFAGFAAVRCLLGFAEGAVSPAFITITSIWYKKEEHPLRVGMWVTCNGLAQIAGMNHPSSRRSSVAASCNTVSGEADTLHRLSDDVR